MGSKITDITGHVYNRLTAIKYVGRCKNSYRSKWLFQCECGNTVESDMVTVRNGTRKSCGCLKREKNIAYLKEHARKEYGESCKNNTYISYRNNAKYRDLPFELTKEEFYNLISQNCSYCGSIPLNESRVQWNDDVVFYQGIDRIDSAKGYSIDNCVPCCKLCNLGKRELSTEQFFKWITNVYNHSLCK